MYCKISQPRNEQGSYKKHKVNVSNYLGIYFLFFKLHDVTKTVGGAKAGPNEDSGRS